MNENVPSCIPKGGKVSEIDERRKRRNKKKNINKEN